MAKLNTRRLKLLLSTLWIGAILVLGGLDLSEFARRARIEVQTERGNARQAEWDRCVGIGGVAYSATQSKCIKSAPEKCRDEVLGFIHSSCEDVQACIWQAFPKCSDQFIAAQRSALSEGTRSEVAKRMLQSVLFWAIVGWLALGLSVIWLAGSALRALRNWLFSE